MIIDIFPFFNEFEILKELLRKTDFKSQLINHSRNFGSFAAIKTGLEQGTGQYFAYMAADLQESPQLIKKIFIMTAGSGLNYMRMGN